MYISLWNDNMNQVLAAVDAFQASMVDQMLFQETCIHHTKPIGLKKIHKQKAHLFKPAFAEYHVASETLHVDFLFQRHVVQTII